MSFIENISREGIFDYFSRRIAFLFGAIMLSVTLIHLIIKQAIGAGNTAITITLAVLAVVNFAIALIMFLRYKQLKGNRNIKYIKFSIKFCRLIIGIVGFALTMSLTLSNANISVLYTVFNTMLTILYAIYIIVQLSIMLLQFLSLIKQGKKQ